MGDDRARATERTRAVYDEIASHFAQTREYPWPEVTDFLDRVDGGAVGLDVGCGNARHGAPLASATDRVVCLDVSRGLLAEARARKANEEWVGDLVQGDAAGLPVADGTVDVLLSIATIHHLPDRAARVKSLREVERVLAPEGRALVSAWSTAHDRFDADPDAESGFDTTVDWTLPDGEVVDRFYHIYDPGEFEDDVAESALEPVSFEVSSGNCYAVVGPEL